MKIFFGCAGAVLLLAGCGSDERGGGNDGAAAQTNQAATPAAAPEATAAPAAARPAVALEADGLRLADGRRLAFGAPKEHVVKDLSAALGKPPTEQSENDECGGGYLDSAGWDGNFYTLFDEGKFAGWDDRGRFETESGLKVGSPRAQVAALTGVSIEESTLGIEFSAGGLGGVLASKAKDAKVASFWAGATCVAR